MVLLFISYALMATQPIMDHCKRDGRFLVRFFTLEGRFPFYLITRAVSMLHNGIFLNFKHLSVKLGRPNFFEGAFLTVFPIELIKSEVGNPWK